MRLKVFRSKGLQKIIIECLSNIVDGKKILLMGQKTPSLRNFFSEAGATPVFLSDISFSNTSGISDFYYKKNAILQNPRYDILNVIRKIDPNKEAFLYAGSAINTAYVDGRKVLGSRKLLWSVAEMKKTQTMFTVNQQDYHPVYIEGNSINSVDDLIEYCNERSPCVISGDVKNQISMGSEYVYFVSREIKESLLYEICRNLFQCCRGFRIANFTVGLPITVYGYVDGCKNILTFPAVEAIVGYRKSDYRIFAPGISTPAFKVLDKRNIDNSVRCVVDNLLSFCDYKGAFGIDGVYTKNGFIIHEVNPRVCAGFTLVSELLDNELPLGLIDIIIRENAIGYEQILLQLHELTHDMNYSPTLKLWDNSTLEKDLRRSISCDNWEEILKWKCKVRNDVLIDCVSFLSMEF